MVSIVTLIIFIYQTNIMREQSRLEVKPRLVFNTSVQSNDSIVTFSFFLRNKGLGPAIVKKARIIHESEIYPLNFDVFLDFTFPDIESYGNLLTTFSLINEDIISVDETVTLFVFEANTKDIPKINEYLKLNDSDYILPWDVEITYESLYEEEWKLNYQRVNNSIERNR